MTKIYGFNDKYQMVEILVDQDPVALFDREHNQETEKWVFDANGKAVKAEPKVVAEPKIESVKVDRKPPYYVAPVAKVKTVAEPEWKKIRPVRDALIALDGMRRPAMRRKSDYKRVSGIERLSDLLKRAKISTDPDQPGFIGSFVIDSNSREWDSILNDENVWRVMSDLDIDLEYKFNMIFIH